MAVPTRLLLLCASLASFGCSDDPAHVPSTQNASQGVSACGPFGHVLDAATPGDLYVATDPLIQSSVVSNGVVTVSVTDDAWSFAVVSRTSPAVPLVIQLRDA